MLLAAVNQMTEPMSIGSPMLYAVFFAIVAILLLVDLFTFKTPKNGEAVSMKQAGIWSAIWVGVSVLFAGGLWWYLSQNFGNAIPHCQNSCHPHPNNPNGGKGDNHGTIQCRTQTSNIKQTFIT